MTPDPAFEEWIAQARGADLVAEVERRGIKLARGHERAGACPIERQGTDRFAVNTRKNIWHCRHCGTGGDVIKLVEMADKVDFVGACEILTGAPPPRGPALTAEERAAIARRNAEREAEAEGRRRAQEEASARYREEERERLYRIWQAGRPVPGSPAGLYLAGRGIPQVPCGAALRFHAAAGYFVPDGKGWRKIHTGPAMLAAITGLDGRFRGLHTTYLVEDGGRWAKFSPGVDDKGEALPAKKVRGSKKGNWIVLRRAARPERLIAGEGIETVLSAWHALASTGRLREGDLFASSIDLGNLGGKAATTVPHPTEFTLDAKGHRRACRVGGPVPDLGSEAMPVPDGVTEAILLGDGDSDRFATENTLIRGGARIAHLHPSVRAVRCAWADEDADFNDMLEVA